MESTAMFATTTHVGGGLVSLFFLAAGSLADARGAVGSEAAGALRLALSPSLTSSLGLGIGTFSADAESGAAATALGESLAHDLADPLFDVLADVAASERRLYLTGMIGSSLDGAEGNPGDDAPGGAMLDRLLGGSIMHGEGAIGVEILRPFGGLRVELEGRHRATPSRAERSWTTAPAASGTFRSTVADEWSTMVNAWRDLQYTEHFGGYFGGGLGIGGCSYAFAGRPAVDGEAAAGAGSGRLGGFAWQVGGGLTYALSDRITCDVGYRFHALEPTGSGGRRAAEAVAVAGSPLGLSAGEVVFAVRIYNPFQGWLRPAAPEPRRADPRKS
jgi:opacity protein-like surface antigen